MSIQKALYVISFIVSLVVISVALFAILLPVLIIVFVTGLIGRFGVYDIKSEFGKRLSRFQLTEIRGDIIQLASRDAEAWAIRDTEKELRKIRDEGQRRHEDGEFLFSVSATLVLGLQEALNFHIRIPILPNLSNLGVELLFLTLTLLILTRVALLGRLTYDSVDEVESGDLETAVSWQKAVSKIDIPFLLILIMGVLRGVFGEQRYHAAFDVLSIREDYPSDYEWIVEEIPPRL